MTGDGYGCTNFDGISVFAEPLESFFSFEVADLMLATPPSVLLLGNLILESRRISDALQAMATPLPKPLFRHKTARYNRTGFVLSK
ncbi:unnamed protein product [Clavelina lepadiformis]|uniref:Uncharacterized protein n=1 Tax=Clavelina lepadiformis TaxID=159417 RepID=A0ABP0FKH1_CLALP